MRYAWTWRIKPNRIDEYVRMHKEPWPEIMREHSAAGIRDYSIHRDGNQFFYTFECDAVEAAFRYLAASDARASAGTRSPARWSKRSFDFDDAEPIQFLEEVFRLE